MRQRRWCATIGCVNRFAFTLYGSAPSSIPHHPTNRHAKNLLSRSPPPPHSCRRWACLVTSPQVAIGFGLPPMPAPPEDPLTIRTPAMKTLMHTAAYHGHIECCKWLLERTIESARKAAVEADGPTAADPAEAATLALVNAEDRLGLPPLFFAEARGHREVAMWLRHLST